MAAPRFPRALVIGASSGIGAELVRQLAREGAHVAALARRKPELDALAHALAADVGGAPGKVLTRAHDVTDVADVPAAFEEVVRALGGLDLVVFAAGVMPVVGPEEYDTDKDLGMVDANLGGCIAWGNAAARYFHTQRAGTLVGIGSIAGDRGRKGNPVYGASKAGMDHYLEALRNRLAERGVRVLTVKPGMVETPMTAHLEKLVMPVGAERAAREILAAARGRLWNIRYVPLRWWAVSVAIRAIPSFLFRRTNV